MSIVLIYLEGTNFRNSDKKSATDQKRWQIKKRPL
jgi:hypothetical protein